MFLFLLLAPAVLGSPLLERLWRGLRLGRVQLCDALVAVFLGKVLERRQPLLLDRLLLFLNQLLRLLPLLLKALLKPLDYGVPVVGLLFHLCRFLFLFLGKEIVVVSHYFLLI